MSSDAPLGGIVVADFSRVLAGPLATMTLADLGATVIKIERPGAGDDTRAWGPPWNAAGSTYFASVNRGKRSVTLDLADAGDRELAVRLATRADVLVENFGAGRADRLGLGFEPLLERNPRLVYCSITGFGPGSSLPGYDFLVQAMGGLMSVTGADEPTKAGVALVDVLCGLHATIGILAALRSGRGQKVEVNLLSSLLSGLVNQASAFVEGGVVPGRMGNDHPSITPYGLYACADGPLAVAVGNDRQFAALCGAVGLAKDARFATNPDRVAHRDALRAALEERLATRPAADWAQALTAAGVPCGPVNDIAGAIGLAERLGLATVVEQPRADGTVSRTVASPITFSGTPVRYAGPPPALGEHDAEIRAWLEADV